MTRRDLKWFVIGATSMLLYGMTRGIVIRIGQNESMRNMWHSCTERPERESVVSHRSPAPATNDSP